MYIKPNNDISEEDKSIIKKNKVELFLNMNSNQSTFENNNKQHKGVFILEIEENLDIYVIINDLDHLRFEIYIDFEKLESLDNTKISQQILNFFSMFNKLKENLDGHDFTHDDRYGYITSCTKYLGSGIKMGIELKLKNYLKNEQFIINKITTSNKFSYEIVDGMEGLILLKNAITLGRYELEIINDLIKMANIILDKDKE